jgi:hypothetical protein
MKAGNRKRIIDSVAAGRWRRIQRRLCGSRGRVFPASGVLPKRELAAFLSPRKAVFSFRFRVLAQAYRGTREILLEPTQ